MKDIIIDTTGRLLTLLGIEFSEILVVEEKDMIRVNIVATEPSRVIGWHGETLNVIQHLVKSMIRTEKKMEKAPFLVMDTDGYRLMQEEKVKRIAEAKADFVRRTGARVTLPPMSPCFRRIVHMHVANTPALADLATESVGEGDYRQIVIRTKNEKTASIKPDAVSEELSPIMTSDDGLENLDI